MRASIAFRAVALGLLITGCGAGVGGGGEEDDEGGDPGVGGAGGSGVSRPGGRTGTAGTGGATGAAGATGITGGTTGSTGGSRGSAGAGGSGSGTADAGAPRADSGSLPTGDGGAAVDPTTVRTHMSDFVFDEKKVATYAITIAAADLQRMNNALINNPSATKELWVPATLKVDNEDVGRIGVRYKGAYGTLLSCVSAGMITCKKMSYKIDVAQYDDPKRFHGLKKVNLHALRADGTHLHERLGYKLFRQMGIPAPRSVHGKVMVNGEYKGLYAVTEVVDGRFTDYWFPKGQGDGNLYKEAWPLSTDPNYYTSRQKTNEMMIPPTKVVAGARAIGAASSADLPRVIDQWMNLDHMFRYLAVDRATTNWDGIYAFYAGGPSGMGGNHNFYLYESQTENRLYLIPWDLDNTFQVWSWWDAVGPWDMPSPSCGMNVQVFTNWLSRPACDRIFRGLTAAGRARYVAALNQLLDGPFNVARMQADIDAWAAQIGEAVMADLNGPGFVAWMANVASFKTALPLLREKMMAIRDGKWPTPFGLKLGTPNGFEGVPQLNFAMGVTSGASRGTSIEHALNGMGAIAGTTDLRLGFELRNSADTPQAAYDQRAYVRLSFDGAPQANLQNLRQMRVRLKSDRDRPVRIELGSSRYKPYTAGGRTPRFGWETMATAAGNTVTLERSAIGFAPGITATGDVVADVLSAVNQIYLMAQPATRDGSGLMPAGSSEKGWLQVDEVELVMN